MPDCKHVTCSDSEPQKTQIRRSRDELGLDQDGPTLFALVEEQLGLRLVPAKAPVEVLVIDHAEKPSGN